jgi:predicted MPP superfamily phosphohydrolase
MTGKAGQVTHNTRCDEVTFIEVCLRLKSTAAVSKEIGISQRNVVSRRNKIHERTGTFLNLDSRSASVRVTIPPTKKRTTVDLHDGCIVVGSDAHYWPDIDSTAHKAFVFIVKKLKPSIIIMNGDSFDGSTISRYGRTAWEDRPTVKQELEAVIDKLDEIANASKNSKLLHTWGNHDLRFNTRLSQAASEFERVEGFDFENHFPRWNFTMSIMVNDNTMIKHRWHNGVHATWNNILKSGRNFVTGHLHSLQIRPFSDYNGTRYAVDTGTLAYPDGDQFGYAEDNPKNHRSGFAVLTFIDGELMPPETVEVIDEEQGICFFRGQKFKV